MGSRNGTMTLPELPDFHVLIMSTYAVILYSLPCFTEF
uniref:Uncharacterized protein n=1 Tax=Anguilla anguilla TaxID=7936 RepID=A0A0E9W0T9_ANGAN